MALLDYELSDRYLRDDGRVFLSGSQALARLPLEQLRADRRDGLRTAAYVSGYPGSPLANYDRDVAAAAALAAADGLTLIAQPGLNEELAATAVMGSQLAVTLASCRFDGVLGIWYGKAPGLDRAGDALRHAVFAGTAARGGAVALVGDDPRAKSSTLPSSSDATLVDLRMPVFYPGDVQEALDLGRHAIALSRAAGLWTAVKMVDAVADGTGTVELAHDRIRPVVPSMEIDGRPFTPHPSGALLTPFTLELEREFHEVRLVIAERYGAENRLNTVIAGSPSDWLGIVATGHTARETMEALRVLGLDGEDALRAAGVRVLRLAMPVPLAASTVRGFAAGLTDVLVVEEKGPTLERLVKDALYPLADRPRVAGKRAPDDTRLVPSTGTLDADTIAPILRGRLLERLAPERLAPLPAASRQLIPLQVSRSPYFCSGCPHNTSTKTPPGTLVGGGIGCHSMVMLMEPERTGPIVGLTAMGNEGAQWLGMAPFVDDRHLVQNIGDGTLFHSGILAVRAAAASGVDITFKILYNGAVAMTGGQHAVGALAVPELCAALLAEGVRRIIVTTDDLARYRDVELPPGVEVWGRRRLVEAQQELAAYGGCTVLVHDQRCAAELRRDRKRGRAATPRHRVVINERVCEGCGDCGDVSNCLSVQPVDTPYGRKTRIDQHSCNLDFSCTEGDCPSFATVTPRRGVARRRPRLAAPDGLPDPPAHPVDDFTVRMSGIGGTGVVTVSQIVGTAAMLGGLHVRGLDQTGLSQKAGPVVSDLRLSKEAPQQSNKATARSVDVLLAFDQLVAGSDAQLAGASADRTVLVANSAVVPTGAMVVHPDLAYPAGTVAARLDACTREQVRVDATAIVDHVLGDTATTNVFLVGVAVQLGHLPLAPELLERAITLNGVSVDANLASFRWGRAWACNPSEVEARAGVGARPDETAADTGDALVDRLARDLRGYQSARLERTYREVIERVAAAGHQPLTDAVARNLHRLMAYKDEYEVARLLLLPESRAAAEEVGGKGARVHWLLHPPVLRALGMRRKIRLGRWATPLFWGLRAGRRVRGTPLDPFGYARVRRLERALVREYLTAIDTILAHLADDRLDEAVAIAELPDQVRGYERLKLQRAEAYRRELARRLEAFSR